MDGSFRGPSSAAVGALKHRRSLASQEKEGILIEIVLPGPALLHDTVKLRRIALEEPKPPTRKLHSRAPDSRSSRRVIGGVEVAREVQRSSIGLRVQHIRNRSLQKLVEPGACRPTLSYTPDGDLAVYPEEQPGAGPPSTRAPFFPKEGVKLCHVDVHYSLDQSSEYRGQAASARYSGDAR